MFILYLYLMEKIIGIYKITNPNGKIYIGKTKDFENRKLTYKHKKCKGQCKLYNSIMKYGWNSHEMILIENCLISELNHKERYWQDYYDVLNKKKGLNLVLQECHEKKRMLTTVSINNIKLKLNKHARSKKDPIYQYDLNGTLVKKWKNLSDIKDNSIYHYSYVSACYSERYLKAYDFLWTKKETFFTEDILKIVKVTKSDKFKGNTFNLGRVLTQEHKDKISKKTKGFKHSREVKDLISKSKFKHICQYSKDGDFIKSWDSAKNAGKLLNITPQNISSCCKGRLKTAGGFKWEYEIK